MSTGENEAGVSDKSHTIDIEQRSVDEGDGDYEARYARDHILGTDLFAPGDLRV